ncbi:MAG TPA: ABC transporter ATP-binding protein [Egibacteraceae bacterium]|nr:ABC transporter ATP-binding protein [Egibacteraceae bacterium]
MSTAQLPRSAADRRLVRRGFSVLGMAIRTEPRSFIVSVVGAVVYSAMVVAAAIVFGAVTDHVILPAFETGETTRGGLALTAAAIVGVAVLKALGIVLRRVAGAYMQYKLQAVFRKRIARQYQRLPLAWHRRHTAGELLSNANADVEATFWPIAPLAFAVGTAVLLVITAVVLVLTDAFLAAVGFLVAPAIAGLNLRYNTLVKQPATRAQQRRADVSSVAHESFEGALVVKTLGREAAETERFRQESERLRDDLVTTGRLRALFDPLVESLPTVGILLVLLVGGWRISTGDLQPGELVRIAYLFTLLAFPIRMIGYLLGELPRSVVGWERLERVLTATDELAYGDRDGGGRRHGAQANLESVAYRYGEFPVLSDVTLRADAGKTIAVVGPTGSGKSTIAALLVRLADPDGGAVLMDGTDLRRFARGVVADQVAVVFQDSFLFDDSVRENITLGAAFSDEEVRAAAELAQAHTFISALPDGYATVVGEGGASLSGGQRQRIALARALVRRPRILLLDDATSSVDTTVERAILEGLRDADLPSTVIVVASRPATIALADTVVFVDQGEVRGRGTHQELLRSHPAYARLVTAYDKAAS